MLPFHSCDGTYYALNVRIKDVSDISSSVTAFWTSSDLVETMLEFEGKKQKRAI